VTVRADLLFGSCGKFNVEYLAILAPSTFNSWENGSST